MRKEYLKIRDDVDLKELERFGYYKHPYSGNYQKIIEDVYSGFGIGFRTITKSIFITSKDRVVYYSTNKNRMQLATIDNEYIQDLISANLVEKVVEDE